MFRSGVTFTRGQGPDLLLQPGRPGVPRLPPAADPAGDRQRRGLGGAAGQFRGGSGSQQRPAGLVPEHPLSANRSVGAPGLPLLFPPSGAPHDSNEGDETLCPLPARRRPRPMRDTIGTKVPRSWILLACIGLIALNMRGPFVAVAPVLGPMQDELGFSPVELGLLTGIPVLCFSLAAPLASLAGRRLGAEMAITLTLRGRPGWRGGPLGRRRGDGDGGYGHPAAWPSPWATSRCR